ncbi:hypothetical protein [uncultured Modestobacter sp.]|uniref:hypothetical protein n=1 Tax=uncultured Modestobacter sp. TaxID=380048 RepID=UPI002623B8AC|nr:hypothetical protein [uncultured Modestobacter sp.]
MTSMRTVAAGVALLVVPFVSSCSSSGPSSSTEPSALTSSSPSSNTPTVAPDPGQDARSEALALVPSYLRAIDDLYLDPSRALDELYEVTVAPEAAAQATAIAQFRSQGSRQTGRAQLVTAAAGEVDLTSEPGATPSPVLPTVVVTACVDVSQVQAVDSAGTSIVAPSRPDYLIEQLTIVNINYPDPASWRVSEAPNTQAQTCDG